MVIDMNDVFDCAVAARSGGSNGGELFSEFDRAEYHGRHFLRARDFSGEIQLTDLHRNVRDAAVFLVCCSGGRLNVEGCEPVTIGSEDYIFCTPLHSVKVALEPGSEQDVNLYVVGFDAISGPVWVLQNRLVRNVDAKVARTIRYICDSMIDFSRGPGGDYIVRNLSEFLSEIVRENIRAGGDGQVPLRYMDILRRANEYIRKNLHDSSLSVEDVSAHLSVSVRTIYFAFSYSPDSMHDTIINLRLAAALDDIIQNRGKKIYTVAMDAGFSSMSTFYRCFKKKYGVPPRRSGILADL